MKKSTKGILFALLAASISGVAIFYSKISVTKIDPLVLTTSRNLYVGILFTLLIVISGKLKEIKKLNSKQFVLLTLIGLVGGAIPFYLFFTGLAYMPAISANLIQKSLFIWVTILAVIFLKEKINRWYLLSFVFIFLGNYYFSNFKIELGIGPILVLTATLLWSVESIIAKKVLVGVSSDLTGFFRMGVGSVFLLSATLLAGKSKLLIASGFQHPAIILIGGSLLFFYVFAWYKAIKYAPASLVTLILTLAVVVGNVLNGSFAGVKIGVADVYSSIIITGAIALLFIQKLHGQTRSSALR